MRLGRRTTITPMKDTGEDGGNGGWTLAGSMMRRGQVHDSGNPAKCGSDSGGRVADVTKFSYVVLWELLLLITIANMTVLPHPLTFSVSILLLLF
jgi:hypothetical protein